MTLQVDASACCLAGTDNHDSSQSVSTATIDSASSSSTRSMNPPRSAWQVAMQDLQAKVMTVMAENTRLKTELRRQQTSTNKSLSALSDRLQALEQHQINNNSDKENNKNHQHVVTSSSAKEHSSDATTSNDENNYNPNELLEARVRALERIIVNSTKNNNNKTQNHRGRHSDREAASSATRTARSRSRGAHSTHSSSTTQARANRLANAKAVSEAIEQQETAGEQQQQSCSQLDSSLSLSNSNFFPMDEPENCSADNAFPILSSSLPNLERFGASSSPTKRIKDKVKLQMVPSASASPGEKIKIKALQDASQITTTTAATSPSKKVKAKVTTSDVSSAGSPLTPSRKKGKITLPRSFVSPLTPSKKTKAKVAASDVSSTGSPLTPSKRKGKITLPPSFVSPQRAARRASTQYTGSPSKISVSAIPAPPLSPQKTRETLEHFASSSKLSNPVSPIRNRRASMSGPSIDTNNKQYMLQPFTAEEMAQAQAEDDQLTRYLENPGSVAMYPRFCMSTHEVNGTTTYYLFRKRVYVPPALRTATMEHYHSQAVPAAGEDWAQTLLQHKIWPSIDADIDSFRKKMQQSL